MTLEVTSVASADVGCDELRTLQNLLWLQRDHLVRRARARCGQQEAEDVVHDALIKASEKLATFQEGGEAGLRAWLMLFVRRRFSDLRRRPRPIQDAPAAPEESLLDRVPARDNATPSRCARRNERRKRLREIMAEELTQRERIALEMRLERVPSEEVAARLGLTVESLRNLVSRALRKLSAKVGPSLMPSFD